MKNVQKNEIIKYYCMLHSFNGGCSFWCFPPLLCSQVSVSGLVTHLKFLVLLPVSLQLLLLKLFADVIFQGSNISIAVLSLSAFFQNNLYIQSISLNETEF